MHQRIKYWEKSATPTEIIDKLLDIICISEYALWHELMITRGHNNVCTHSDIIATYHHLKPNNKVKFYCYCNTIGIYSTFIKILGEHS